MAKSGAALPQQANALFRKNLVYQARNKLGNLCLVLAPICFCLLLWVLGGIVNKAIRNNPDNKCGCRCTSCCKTVNTTRECWNLTRGFCDKTRGYKCEQEDKNECGLQWSSSKQALWCPIPTPSSWPPFIQVPFRPRRPPPGGNVQQMLFTGNNLTLARSLANNLVVKPDISVLDLPKLQQLAATIVSPKGDSVNAYLLAQVGLLMGTGYRATVDYYIDSAIPQSSAIYEEDLLDVVLPFPLCNTYNLTGNMSVPEFLYRYLLAENPVLLPLLLQSYGLSPGDFVAKALPEPLSGVYATCINGNMSRQLNTTMLNRVLHCSKPNCSTGRRTYYYGTAWDFGNSTSSGLQLATYYNLTNPVVFDGSRNYRIAAAMNLGVKAWARQFLGGVHGANLLGLMSYPKPKTVLNLDFSSVLGPLFYSWVVLLLLPTFLQQLVYEKELRLRMIMKMHGLGDMPYWTVTYCYWMLVYIVYIILFVGFGSAIGLALFTKNSYGVQAVLYLLFGSNMLAFSFMLSSFFSSNRTAAASAVLYVLASGLIGQLLLSDLMEKDMWWLLLVELIPSFALYRGLWELSSYAYRATYGNLYGMAFKNLLDPANHMPRAWIILAVEWVIFMLSAWYLEQVTDSGTGARRHPFFIFQWRKKVHATPERKAMCSLQKESSESPISSHDSSVKARSIAKYTVHAEPVAASSDTSSSNTGSAQHVPIPLQHAQPPTSDARILYQHDSAPAAGSLVHSGLSLLHPAALEPVADTGDPACLKSVSSARTLPLTPFIMQLQPHMLVKPTVLPQSQAHAYAPQQPQQLLSRPASQPPLPPALPPPAPPPIIRLSFDVVNNVPARTPFELAHSSTTTSALEETLTTHPHARSKRGALYLLKNVMKVPASWLPCQPPPSTADPAGSITSCSSQQPEDIKAPQLDGQRLLGCAKQMQCSGLSTAMDGLDVQCERERVTALLTTAGSSAEMPPIVLHGLAKTFATSLGGRKRTAVRDLTLAIERGECFGLLGPNGAGKTTAINMLTGFLEPSGGQAIVQGHDIRKGMSDIYKVMGVCPQHNLLWETLTGEEHLLFYGRLKGLTGAALSEAVRTSLAGVRLLDGGAGFRLTSTYSGGMKRRLSVAIAFIGRPKVVYLDEPSTGLDPASRRSLWSVVRTHKQHCAVILTTHSMEEAEVLCDRLGIFVDGELVCIGAPKEITSRYAGYLVFTISVPPSQEVAAKALVASMSPHARLTYELAGTLKYELPSEDISLSGVFAAMNAAKVRSRLLQGQQLQQLQQFVQQQDLPVPQQQHYEQGYERVQQQAHDQGQQDAAQNKPLPKQVAGHTLQQERQEEGCVMVLDWGVANATLEEVFIKFARSLGPEMLDHGGGNQVASQRACWLRRAFTRGK